MNNTEMHKLAEGLRVGETRTIYHITGVDTKGKRFRIITDNVIHAQGINLYRGSKWEILPNGKRKLLVRVYN